MSEFVTLQAADGHKFSAYGVKPSGKPLGAVVVVQEIFGVNASIRGVADSYAADGFVAIAPALFDRFETGVELTYEGEDMKKAFGLMQKLDPGKAVLDVAAAFAHVATEGLGVGIVGFCYGGFVSWISATRGPVAEMQPACCIGYYAGGIGSVATEEPSCPVMLHFGADDTHIGPEQVEAVRTAHPEVEIFLYDGAPHAFANAARPSFREDAATLARERSLAFLRKYIG